MTATIQPAPSIMRATYESYIKQGFALVPITSGKGPTHRGWNLRENCITDASLIPDHVGVGLAHAFSQTCSIDIDDWDVAVTTLGFVGIDLIALCNAPDAVMIHSGNPGHAKLIYRMPFGLVLPSKKCIHTTTEGLKRNFIDFRCATADGQTVQDLLPSAAIHPITQQHYQWAGSGHYTNLPYLPGELLAYWRSIIDAEETRNIRIEGSHISASWDEIKQALTHISPDCDRDQWITILMALHYAGTVTNKLDEALAVADEWSAQSATKYKGQGDIANSWRGFKPDKGVTLGSLFHLARRGGWERPLPDVSQLFGPIEQVESPKSLLGGLHVPPPSINMNLLPPLLAQRAKEVGVSVGCDPLVAAWAGLGAAAAAIDARTRLELVEGYAVPPILWLCTVGAPADKKTPAAEPMLGILERIEAEARQQEAIEEKIFEANDAAYASAQKAYTEAAKDANWLLGGSDVSQLPYVPEKPQPPIPLRLTVSDITSQKLVRMCADRPRGLLCHLDEMKSWADKVTIPNSGESRSSWTKSYEGKKETMDRVGDGKGGDNNITAHNFAVSIYGNIQPRVFKRYLKPLSEDGLLQRFLPAILRPEMSDTRGEPIPEQMTSSATYEQHIRLLFALPPTRYRLSVDALEAYRDFQLWYLSLKKDERLLNADDTYMTALGKLEGTCGRLILFWHLFDNPHSQEVSMETTLRAISFTKGYIIPALRYAFGEVGGVNTDSHDQYIYEYILQHAGEKPTVSMSDMKRSLKRRVEHLTEHQKDEIVRNAMAALEEANWVKCIEHTMKSQVWAIDARLAEHFAEYRKTVVEAKQRIYDRIHEVSGGLAPRKRVVGSDILDLD